MYIINCVICLRRKWRLRSRLKIKVIIIVYRSLWSIRSYVHINLCVSLMAAQLVFVTAVDKTENEVSVVHLPRLLVESSGNLVLYK